jgi:NitT/TauT family transport system ATP-binding protein
VVVMSPRPGKIVQIVDVDLGDRSEQARESPEFFKKITEVREALRGIEMNLLARGIEDR